VAAGSLASNRLHLPDEPEIDLAAQLMSTDLVLGIIVVAADGQPEQRRSARLAGSCSLVLGEGQVLTSNSVIGVPDLRIQ
jgi:hypothetical protein